MLSAMAGFDRRDSTSMYHPVDDYVGGLEQSLVGLKVGVVKEFMDERLDAGMAGSMQAAIEQLKQLGAEIVEVSLRN